MARSDHSRSSRRTGQSTQMHSPTRGVCEHQYNNYVHVHVFVCLSVYVCINVCRQSQSLTNHI